MTVLICIMLRSIVVIQRGTTMTMTECCNSVHENKQNGDEHDRGLSNKYSGQKVTAT